MRDQGRRQRANRRAAGRLLAVAVAMFGLVYALVPLYDAVCTFTGINGRTGVVRAAAEPIDEARWVKVQLLAITSGQIPWEFRPLVPIMHVHPGVVSEARFYVRNRVPQTVVGQAVPSLTPLGGAPYFAQTECFCSANQRLGPSEATEVAVKFVIDPRLPKQVRTVSLSYTFFELPASA